MAAPKIIDVNDAGDEKLYKQISDSIRGYENEIIPVPKRPDGVPFMVGKIIEKTGAEAGQSLAVLRLWGHGYFDAPAQKVSLGHDPARDDDPKWREAAITPASLPHLKGVLARLKPLFSTVPAARVELRGCSVAKTKEGRNLLAEMARLLSVRVQASEQTESDEIWRSKVWEALPPKGDLRQADPIQVSERR